LLEIIEPIFEELSDDKASLAYSAQTCRPFFGDILTSHKPYERSYLTTQQKQ
jgi:hypothetical protein